MVQSGKIGKIKDVEACFTRIANIHSRERTDPKYGGAFLEYSGNVLMPIIKILGTDYQSVTFDSFDNELGTDDYTKIQIRYKDAMATAKVGMAVKSEGQLIVEILGNMQLLLLPLKLHNFSKQGHTIPCFLS